MPKLVADVAPELKTERVVVCVKCHRTYHGNTRLRLADGSILKCEGCSSLLGEYYRRKGGRPGVRPRLMAARCDLRSALTALWSSADFAGAVLNEDPNRPSSSLRSKRYEALRRQHPVLMAKRGLLRATLYCDYFSYSRHARNAHAGSFGSVYLRIDNLGALGTGPEYVIQLATLTGWRWWSIFVFVGVFFFGAVVYFELGQASSRGTPSSLSFVTS